MAFGLFNAEQPQLSVITNSAATGNIPEISVISCDYFKNTFFSALKYNIMA